MAIPPHFLDELRRRLAVSEVVGRRVALKRHGREFMARCPFHNERTPSFTVSDDKGFYHCFGCGAHGDAISFVMQTESLGFAEAVEKLAAEAGLEVPRASPAERETERRIAGLPGVLEAAARWFEAQLKEPAGRAARAYLRGRGLGEETIARFRLGFAPGRGLLRQALLAQGASEAALVEAGLVKAAEEGGAPRDAFYDRVVFPIGDRRGRPIAFGARALGDAKPKYLNSADTPLFHKGQVLYGWATARQAAAERGEVIAVEGYMDVITLAQAGFANVVAPLGTALTEAQLGELWRLADEPVLCFDGDEAGQRAAFRAAERALPHLAPGKSLRFVALPAGDDPDSLVRNRGAEAFAAALAGARPLDEVVWRLETQGRGLDTPERLAALTHRVTERVRQIADRTVREAYLAAFRARLDGLRPAASRGVRDRASWRKPARPPAIGLRGRHDPADALLLQDKIALALLVNHPSLIETNAERLAEVRLSTPQLDRLLRELLNALTTGGDLDSVGIASHLTQHGFAELLGTVLNRGIYRLAPYAAAEGAAADAAERLGEYLEARRRAAPGDVEAAMPARMPAGRKDRTDSRA